MTDTTTKKTALVLGITGGYGGAMASALDRAGWALRALVRDADRGAAAAERLGLEAELVVGDVLDPSSLATATQGCEVIVHGVNPAYDRWDPFILEAGHAVAEAASRSGATVLFPGNVYNYAPALDVDEDTPSAPPSKKGALRVELEQIMLAATKRGARLIVLRGGDFFGEGTSSSWIQFMVEKALKGGKLTYPTKLSTRHQWAYLPDFAATHVALLEHRGDLPAAAFFHFGGHTLSGDEFVEAARGALGRPELGVSSLPWWGLRLISPFSSMMKAIVEMRYLWDEELIMSDARLQQTLGEVPHTPFLEALATDLAARQESLANAA